MRRADDDPHPSLCRVITPYGQHPIVAVTTTASPDAELGPARAAAALAFFLTGAVFATWAARLPALTVRLALSPGEASVALVGVEAGALAGLAGAGRVVSALGSAKSLRLGFAAYPAALVATALPPSLAWLVAAMAVMGIANSLIDVALNVQGVELERRCARPLLSGLHSAHSFGVVAGGVGGTLCAAGAVALIAHFAAVAAIALLASQLRIGALVSERREHAGDDASRRPRRGADHDARRTRRRLVAIGLLASGAFFVEGAAGDWSAIEMRAVHGAGPGLAGAAFTTFSLALALGRLRADRLVARYGRARFTRAAASVAAGGAAIVALSGSAGIAFVGWAVVGVGVAGIAPTLLGAAPGAGAVPSSVAIATVSAIGYVGSFTGPPVIGALATLTGLPVALASLVPAAGAIALFARPTLDGDA
jgi:MFS family permease